MRESLTEMEKLGQILIEGNLSFKYFAESIVKEIEGTKLEIPNFQQEWIDAAMKHQNVVISASRGHGKCLYENSDIFLSNGKIKKLKDIKIKDKVLALDENNLKIVETEVKEKFDNGKKELYKIITCSGNEVIVTQNHKLRTPTGWNSMEEGLKIDDRIAVPRMIPTRGHKIISDDDVKILAYMIADGGLTSGNANFTKSNLKLVNELSELCDKKDWILKKTTSKYGYRLKLKKRRKVSPIRKYFEYFGVWGIKSNRKVIPNQIMNSTNKQISLFLNRYIACDGWVVFKGRNNQIGICTASKVMAYQFNYLFKKIGILTTIRKTKYAYSIETSHQPSLLKIIRKIGVFTKEKKLDNLKNKLKNYNTNRDTIPIGLIGISNEEIKKIRKKGITFYSAYPHNVSRPKLKKISKIIKNKELQILSNSDIYWDKIKKIEYFGKKQTYDITIPKYHNFIANGIFCHNSVVMGILLPLYIATYNSNKSILIVSPTEERSFEIMQKIRYVIETNEILGFLKPSLGTGAWTKTKLDTSNHCQFFCRCVSPNIRGHQIDYLLIDECGEIDDIETFFHAILPTIYSKNGKCIGIGTPQTTYDLLARLMKNPHFFSMKYPAIAEEGPNKDKPIWPERYSVSRLKVIRRTIGSSRFNKEYLLRLTSGANQVFPMEVILPTLKEDMKFSDYGDSEKNYFIGVDLAYSPQGDYTVFAVLEQIKEGYFLVHLDRMRGVPIPTQERKLADLCTKFKPKRVVIDKSQFGQGVINNMRGLNFPVEGFDFAPNKRGTILFSLQRLFADQKIYIPYSENCQNDIKPLLHELSHIELQDGKFKSTSRHDDLPIALALALHGAAKFKSFLCLGVISDSNIYNKKNNVYDMGSYKEQVEKNRQYISKYKK